MRKLNALLKASTDCEISFLSEKTYYKLFAKHKTNLLKERSQNYFNNILIRL